MTRKATYNYQCMFTTRLTESIVSCVINAIKHTHKPPSFQAYGNEKQPALNILLERVIIARWGLQIYFIFKIKSKKNIKFMLKESIEKS